MSLINSCASFAIRGVALVLFASATPLYVDAQQRETIRAGISVARDASQRPSETSADQLAPDSTRNRLVNTANGALIGAGIGGATGVVIAAIATHQSGVTDHSEDGLAYLGLAAFGAFVGLIVGGFAGFLWE